jgi:hypothetical protein
MHSLVLSAAVLAGLFVSNAASASMIVTGDGDETCLRYGGVVCTPTLITPHSLWQQNLPDGTEARWISYANTGIGGDTLAPQAGSGLSPTGQLVIMTITETFTANAGSSIFTRAWADDTVRVLLDGIEIIAPSFTQDICAAVAPGCQPGEAGSATADILTSGLHTLTFEVYQVGSGGDPDSNPFGLLYWGQVTQAPAVPEPATLALFGAGLMGLGMARHKRS